MMQKNISKEDFEERLEDLLKEYVTSSGTLRQASECVNYYSILLRNQASHCITDDQVDIFFYFKRYAEYMKEKPKYTPPF